MFTVFLKYFRSNFRVRLHPKDTNGKLKVYVITNNFTEHCKVIL